MAEGQTTISVELTATLLVLSLGSVVTEVFRRLDCLQMRMTGLFLALPLVPILMRILLLFRVSLNATFGPENEIFILITVSIGIVSWIPTARIMRGEVLALKEPKFVLVARSINTSNTRLILRHILPKFMSPIMMSATLGITNAIITESKRYFLGLSFPPEFPT